MNRDIDREDGQNLFFPMVEYQQQEGIGLCGERYGGGVGGRWSFKEDLRKKNTQRLMEKLSE